MNNWCLIFKAHIAFSTKPILSIQALNDFCTGIRKIETGKGDPPSISLESILAVGIYAYERQVNINVYMMKI